jgi:hypothetical protein
MTLAIIPSGEAGTVVRGTLFVDVFSERLDIGGRSGRGALPVHGRVVRN